MGFAPLDIPLPTKRLPAVFSLSPRRNGRPATTVSVSAAIAAQANLDETDAVAVMLGDGENAGKLRLVRLAGSPGATPRLFKGTLVYRLGHVPAFGGGEVKVRCAAYAVEPGVVEIDLPNFDIAPIEEVIPAGADARSITMLVGKDRMARLAAFAAEAGEDNVERFACRMFATCIDEAGDE